MTDERRLEALEERLTTMRVEAARLQESVEHLEEAVLGLTISVTGLKSTIDRGSGALWVIIGIASALGALVTEGISRLVGRAA